MTHLDNVLSWCLSEASASDHFHACAAGWLREHLP